MRLAHISDLHLGKRLGSFPLIEEQRDILRQIVDTAVRENCDGVLIAGDIYDKTSPSAEAVRLFDEFLTDLCDAKLSVYMISGNHDSSERVDYGSAIMERSDIHICGEYKGEPEIVTVSDEYGELDICLMPFIKPSYVRAYHEDCDIKTYTDMMRFAIDNSRIDTKRRCVLVCHQFITGALTSESEYSSVGTLDNIGAEVFEGFDYVALGHLHRPQNIRPNIRYCGTPLKYSASEIKPDKSVTIIELKDKNNIELSYIELKPLRDVVEHKDKYEVLMSAAYISKVNTEDYCFITLTDEDDIPYVMQKLRTVYKNIVKLSYDNLRTRTVSNVTASVSTMTKTPQQLFAELFKEQNGADMNSEQTEYIKGLIEKIWGDEE